MAAKYSPVSESVLDSDDDDDILLQVFTTIIKIALRTCGICSIHERMSTSFLVCCQAY